MLIPPSEHKYDRSITTNIEKKSPTQVFGIFEILLTRYTFLVADSDWIYLKAVFAYVSSKILNSYFDSYTYHLHGL